MIKGFLKQTIDLKRKTDLLVDWTTLIQLVGVDRQPVRETNLVLNLEEAITGGCITISGIVGGTGSSEEFAFSQNIEGKQSLKRFTQVSGITTSGLSQGKLRIKTVEKSGQPIYQEYLVKERMKVRIDSHLAKGGELDFGIPGGFTELNYRIVCSKEDGELMLVSDIITENSDRYEIQKLVSFIRGRKTHHIEGVLKKI